MNILYITYDGLTDPLGQSQVLPYVVGNSKNRCSFTILSCEKKDAFEKGRHIIEAITNEYNINWVPLSYTKSPPVISTLVDILNLKKATKKILKEKKIDLIHCRSYIPSIIGLWAKNKYSIPFVFDMRGFWADERIDGGIWTKSNLLHKNIYAFFKKKEIQFLEKSSYTISLTYSAKKEIQSWNLKKAPQIQVIPCCTDEVLFNENTSCYPKSKLNILQNNFVLSYIGSTGTWYMLDEMLDFFKELLNFKPESRFLFITRDEPNFIVEKAILKGIKKEQIIIQSSNRSEVPSLIKVSDLSIFFIKPLYSKKASSPTKMGEIMNLGIPIICNSGVGDVDLLMDKVMPNLLIHNFKPKDYKRAINHIIDCEFDKEKIKNEGRSYFSLKKGINDYLYVYKSVLGLDE